MSPEVIGNLITTVICSLLLSFYWYKASFHQPIRGVTFGETMAREASVFVAVYVALIWTTEGPWNVAWTLLWLAYLVGQARGTRIERKFIGDIDAHTAKVVQEEFRNLIADGVMEAEGVPEEEREHIRAMRESAPFN